MADYLSSTLGSYLSSGLGGAADSSGGGSGGGRTLEDYLPYLKGGAQVGSAIGGLFGGGGSRKAITEAEEMYQKYLDQARQTLEEHEAAGREDITGGLERAQEYGLPYRQAGETALSTQMGALGLGGEEERLGAQRAFKESPSYQFALREGLKGIERGGAVSGLTGSPALQKRMAQYATGLAGQEYGQWQQQLADLASGGRTSAEAAAGREYGAGGQLAQLGLPYAGQIAGGYEQQGAVASQSALARAVIDAERKRSLGKIIGGAAGTLGTLGKFLL